MNTDMDTFEQSPNFGKYIGNCKWFNSRIGYGFVTIVSEGENKGKDIFVHHTGVKPKNSNFRTLHSLAYRALKLDKTNVMKDEHYKDLENILQLRLTNPDSTINTYGAFVADDIYMQLINLAKVKNESLQKVFHEFGHVPGGWLKLDYVDRAVKAYKQERNLFDYTDMLIEYNKHH